MMTETTKVIVSTTTRPGQAIASTQVHHRDLPEIRATGDDPAGAATRLANELTRALDTALTDWRRKNIEQAIADVHEFIDSHS
jgi:uncharacterized lipoprotein YddW (UPF0748 family)